MTRVSWPTLGIRWTVGDVSLFGYETLRLSLWGAYRIFGPRARYLVCVNSVPLAEAQTRTDPVPEEVRWHDASGDVPGWLARHLDDGMAEGVGWKLAPVRCFPALHELALDNDCILWALPAAVRAWLRDDDPGACLIAEDVRCCLGQFAHLAAALPRNSGIRGVPPGFDLESALAETLALHPVTLVSERAHRRVAHRRQRADHPAAHGPARVAELLDERGDPGGPAFERASASRAAVCRWAPCTSEPMVSACSDTARETWRAMRRTSSCSTG